MSIDAAPPPNPPMLSPDKKWFWDGQQWQPIAGDADAGHRGLFPSWNAAHLEAVAAAPPTPVQRAVAAPAISYPLVGMPGAAAEETPLWRRAPKSSLSYPMYVGGGLLFVIVGILLLNALAPTIQWPWSSPPAEPAAKAVVFAPPMPTSRTDFARADVFFTKSLTPAITSLNQSVTLQRESCNGTLTNSCQTALSATDAQLKVALSVIDNSPVPLCITPAVAKAKADMLGMRDGLKSASSAYGDNNRTKLAAGLAVFNKANAPLAADVRSIGSAGKTLCDTTLTGP